MSKILVNCNLQSGEWTIREDNIQPHYTDVMFYFSDVESTVMFDNLTFGLKVKKNGEELYTQSYGINKKFVACENILFDNWLENCRLHLQPNTNYTLEFWCENADIMRTYIHDLMTPDVLQINT
jgi:anaerobic ribonucleoside-triphosphate reductase